MTRSSLRPTHVSRQIPTLFTPEVRSGFRAWLEDDPEQYVLSAENTLLWYQVGYLPAPDQLDGFVAAGNKLYRILLPN
jgi:hypothetical protein